MLNLSLRPMAAGLLLAGAVISLSACQSKESAEAEPTAEVVQDVQTTQTVTDVASAMPETTVLAAILAAQPEAVQARYAARHPAETLAFFGIEPGMNVLEALPGGGWYSKILAPYIGTEGMLVGVDYDQALFPLFGFMSAAQLKAKETWVDTWLAEARGWFEMPVADIDAFQFGVLPERFEGELDAALFIRALHNMARFEEEGGFLSASLRDTKAALKPGGVVGVVQHMAPEDAEDDWADGSAGYLKKSFVIGEFEAVGFEFVGESDVNVNPMDQPTSDDIVWRLPPTLSGSADDPERAAQMSAIGESSRMTLLFRKPE